MKYWLLTVAMAMTAGAPAHAGEHFDAGGDSRWELALSPSEDGGWMRFRGPAAEAFYGRMTVAPVVETLGHGTVVRRTKNGVNVRCVEHEAVATTYHCDLGIQRISDGKIR
jgi:hypothetical protein